MTPQEKKQKLISDFKRLGEITNDSFNKLKEDYKGKATKEELKILQDAFAPLEDTLKLNQIAFEGKVTNTLNEGLQSTRNQVATISNDLMSELKQLQDSQVSNQLNMLEVINRNEQSIKQIKFDNGELI